MSPRRILLTRLRFIGDVVLTTPLIRSVRTAYPDAFLAYLAERQAATLLGHNPFLSEIIAYDPERPSWREQLRVARILRSRRFDLVIDLFGNPRSALLARLSGAPVRVGPDRRGRGRLYTLVVRDDGVPKSAVAFHNQSLAAAGIPATADRTEIFLTAEERASAAALLARTLGADAGGRPIVALHPGATWPAKHWAPERFAGLADRLRAGGCAVVVLAGPRDGEAAAAVQRHAADPIPVLPDLSLRSLAAVIAACAAFAGNDAGPMHISAAVGTPTVGIFGPGEENIWFPYDPAAGHRALRVDVPCHPCHLDVCTRTGDGYMECMRLLTVEQAAAAVLAAARV